MELREMRVFVAIAETGGLSSAARRLHLSQPAVSHTVQAIERELGVQLLVRASTGVQLTETGGALLTEARAVLARYEQAITAVTAYGPSGPAELRIGVPLELPHQLLAAPLAAVASEYPGTKARPRHLSTSAQLAALRAGELDVGMLRERPIGRISTPSSATGRASGCWCPTTSPGHSAGPTGFRSSRWPDWTGSGSPLGQPGLVRPAHSNPARPRHRGRPGGARRSAAFPELKLVTVATGAAFAFAPPDWSPPLPPGITWCPLVGDPVVRRTWAVWPANSRRRDLGRFVASIRSGFDR